MKLEELKFVVQVDPWQSEEIQNAVFEKLGFWGDMTRVVKLTDFPFLVVDHGALMIWGGTNNKINYENAEKDYGFVSFSEAIKQIGSCVQPVFTKKMTVADIEKVLGHKVEIVKG